MTVTYVSPTDQRHAEEKHFADTLAHLFIVSVVAAKAADWTGLARKWSEHGYQPDEFHREVSRKFTDVFWNSAGSILVKAAGMGRGQAIADFEMSVPKVTWDNRAQSWAGVYGHEMSKQIAVQSEKAISDLVPQLMNRGMKGDSLALQAKTLYGLDPRSMNGALNFLFNDKKPRDRTVLDIATQLLSGRAKIIGDVQSFTALNFGRQLTYMEAQDSGLLPKSARKVWVTAIDERVCPVCKPMDGRSVGLTDFFEVGSDKGKVRLLVPPVHPNCRCTFVPEERFKHGIITRTARFADSGEPKHRSKLVQEIEDLVLSKAEVAKFSIDQSRDKNGRWVHQGGAIPDLDYAKVAQVLNSLPVKDKEVWQSPQALGAYLKSTHSIANEHGAGQLVLGVRRWIDMKGVDQTRHIEQHTTPNTTWRQYFKGQARYDSPLRLLMHTASYAPANAPTLYRGMAVPGHIDLPKKGQKFNLPLSSFAAHPHVAANYTGRESKWYERNKKHTAPVMVVLEGGSKSLNISPVAKYGTSEWITKGRFVVTGVSGRTYVDGNGKAKKVKTIFVKQLPKRQVEKTFDGDGSMEFFDILATPLTDNGS